VGLKGTQRGTGEEFRRRVRKRGGQPTRARPKEGAPPRKITSSPGSHNKSLPGNLVFLEGNKLPQETKFGGFSPHDLRMRGGGQKTEGLQGRLEHLSTSGECVGESKTDAFAEGVQRGRKVKSGRCF